jgi:hypothetical protein
MQLRESERRVSQREAQLDGLRAKLERDMKVKSPRQELQAHASIRSRTRRERIGHSSSGSISSGASQQSALAHDVAELQAQVQDLSRELKDRENLLLRATAAANIQSDTDIAVRDLHTTTRTEDALRDAVQQLSEQREQTLRLRLEKDAFMRAHDETVEQVRQLEARNKELTGDCENFRLVSNLARRVVRFVCVCISVHVRDCAFYVDLSWTAGARESSISESVPTARATGQRGIEIHIMIKVILISHAPAARGGAI